MQPITFLFLSISVMFGSLPNQPGVGNGNIIVNEGTVSMFGSMADSIWSRRSFQAGIVAPYRLQNGYFIHDDAGITFLTWDDSTVTEFKVMFISAGEGGEYWWAKTGYTGSAVIENIEVTHETSFAELDTKLPQYNFPKKGPTHYGSYHNIYIYANFDDADLHLRWMSIGRVHKK